MYGKIFESIYDGTLHGDWKAIVTMQQLIVLANADGIVDMTYEAIAARTSIPLDIIECGIMTLLSPDPHSRTPGEEGRRIVLLDAHRPWGWRLVNHAKYSKLRNMEQKREADRTRIAAKRRSVDNSNPGDKENKTQEINNVATTSQPVANVAHAYADADEVLIPPSPLSKGGEEKKNEKPNPRWWEDDELTKAKARSVGLDTQPGESWADFRSRIRAAINGSRK